MNYASAQDCIDRYGEKVVLVLAGVSAADQLPGSSLDQALEDATEEINGYLGARYTLPLEPAPDILKRLAVDIALYRISSGAAARTEERRLRYKDATAILDRISKGVVTLGLPGAGAAGRSTRSRLPGPRRFFPGTE